MNQYYPPYRSSRHNIKVELDLANYATKTDLNNITHVDVGWSCNHAAPKSKSDPVALPPFKGRAAPRHVPLSPSGPRGLTWIWVWRGYRASRQISINLFTAFYWLISVF